MTKNNVISATLCSVAFLIACAASHGMHIHPTSGYFTGCYETVAHDHAPQMADLLVISDTHASFPEAPHELTTNNYVSDSVIGAAMRPPQMDFWGTRVFAWILRQTPKVQAIVHLGDVANISCEYEFDRFSEAIRRYEDARVAEHIPKVPWFFTPGNHDSLLMGNLAYEAPTADVDTRWGRECGAARPMDKKALLRKYLAAKKWTEEDREIDGLSDRTYRCASVNTGEDTDMAAAIVCHRIPCHHMPDSPERPSGAEWGDFIVQVIRLRTSTLILLDSSDYREMPRLLQMGGAWGGISAKQIAALQWILDKHKPASRVVIGTHYPVDTLDKFSQIAVQSLIESLQPFAILTAHTHFPTAERWHDLPNSTRHFLEVNVGSVIGWPMEFAYMTVPDVEQPTLEITVASVARTLADPDDVVAPKAPCDAWKVPGMWDDTAFEYYTHYHRPRGYARLLKDMFNTERAAFAKRNVVLSSYLFVQELATVDEKAALSRDGVPDASLDAATEDVSMYELCQAVFASAADDGDKLEFRRLKPADHGTARWAFNPDPPAEKPQVPIRGSSEQSRTVRWTFDHVGR